MYGVYDPIVVYGLLEKERSEKVISEAFLQRHDVERFPVALIRLHAVNFVYGVVPFHFVKLSPPKKAKEVVAKLIAALDDEGVDLGEPKFYLAIRNYEYEHERTDYLK